MANIQEPNPVGPQQSLPNCQNCLLYSLCRDLRDALQNTPLQGQYVLRYPVPVVHTCRQQSEKVLNESTLRYFGGVVLLLHVTDS